MATYEQIKVKMAELVNSYPATLRFITNENDVDNLNFDIIMENGFKEFYFTDDNLISYLSEKLQEGCEVVIQPAGSDKFLVFAANGLFKR